MKILIVQNRMGIGDMVIFLPYIEAISKKFKVPVNLLVKENSKATEFLKENKNIDEIIYLDRGNQNKKGKHDGVLGSLKLIKDIKKYKFDKIFIFNSSIRFRLIAKLSGIKDIYQYPLFSKKNQHIINTAKEFIRKKLDLDINNDPTIITEEKLINNAKLKYDIDNNKLNILLGIGGSGPTKQIPSKTFINVVKKILKEKECKFFLATGQNENEQKILKEITNSEFSEKCIALDKLSINEILPIIKNCQIAICNDSSFSHLSSALGIKTIVLMADTPLIYGSYSTKMYPIIPVGEQTVNHNTRGKNKISSDEIFEKFKEIIL